MFPMPQPMQIPQIAMPAPGINLTGQQGPAMGLNSPFMPPAQPPVDMPPIGMGPMGMPAPAPQMNPWQQLTQKFMEDRSLQMGLLQMGLQMMQPVPVGQSTAGHFATSLGHGVNTTGSVREKDRQIAIKDKEIAQTDKRIGLDQQRVDLEGRRVAEAEATGKVGREGALQTIKQNEKKYPLTIKELDAKIDKLVGDKKLDEANIDLIREKVRLMPDQVAAELRRAKASELSAGKPSGTEAILHAVAAADAKKKGFQSGTPEYEKAFNESLSEHGGAYFAKSGSATVQSADAYTESWKQANPKKEGETDASYQQRVGTAKAKYMDTKKEGSYRERLQKYLGENSVFIRTPEDRQRAIENFDAGEKHADTRDGAPKPGEPKTIPGAKRTEISRSEFEATVLSRKLTTAQAKALEAALKKQGVSIK